MRTIPTCAYEEPLWLGPPTDERWRAEYRRKRYMEDYPEQDLRQRFKDIFRNFMTINANGKASPLPTNHRWHTYWRLRFNHVVEEFALRFGPYPGGLRGKHLDKIWFPNPRSPRLKLGRAAVAHRNFEYGKNLFKFGKRSHLEATLQQGLIRIAPASSFANDQFNHAIRDIETEIEHWIHNPTVDDLKPLLDGPEAEAPSEGSAICTRTSEDAWLYCLSASYDAAMYDDFDCDACLIINDPKEFRNRLLVIAHKKLGARGYAFSPVTYVDPLTQFEETVPILLQKHARHAYQDELRAMWLPQIGGQELKTEFLQIGSLESIAELVSLE